MPLWLGQGQLYLFYIYTKYEYYYFITFCCLSRNPDSSSVCSLSRNVVQEDSCLDDDNFSSFGDKRLV